jgi:asparagine synthase (glutamine-hydrolysing)
LAERTEARTAQLAGEPSIGTDIGQSAPRNDKTVKFGDWAIARLARLPLGRWRLLHPARVQSVHRSRMNECFDGKQADSLRMPASHLSHARFRGSVSTDALAGSAAGNGAVAAAARDGLQRIEAPGLDLSFDPSRARLLRSERSLTLICGEPRTRDLEPLASDAIAAALHTGAEALDPLLGGRFSIVHIDFARRRVLFVTDRFAVLPICYSVKGDHVAFADRADAVPTSERRIDPQSIYDYVYFHVIPAPQTIFRGVFKVEAATRLEIDAGGTRATRWWRPVFAADPGFRQKECGQELRRLLNSAVERSLRPGKVGAYLSGGTDSSSVAGILGLICGRPAETYSIGFAADGYDEMMYARIAARHFGSQHHELYVTPKHVADGIPVIAAGYDQPFGNSSALPAYFCAKMAHDDGVGLLLAGDGGDELFGGNARYARQKILDAYWKLPRLLRQRVVEPALLGSRLPQGLPVVSKVASYVTQARVPMPARTETYNQLNRIGAASVLSPGLLAAIDAGRPARLQTQVYEEVRAASLVDHMLGFDWRFTLTDNDLPKVSMTAALAGVEVGFPMLDDALVDFSLRLPAEQKVRRLQLRYFFKKSLRGFLPDEILRKKKHGFGLPIGPWLLSEPELFTVSQAAVAGLVARGLVRPEFATELLSVKLSEHAGFYGEIVWVLLMLEHWLLAHVPQYTLDN